MHPSEEALSEMLPVAFNWPMFLLALAFMGAPIVNMCWKIWSSTTQHN